jgi:uncharacterized protein (DUF885 family)
MESEMTPSHRPVSAALFALLLTASCLVQPTPSPPSVSQTPVRTATAVSTPAPVATEPVPETKPTPSTASREELEGLTLDEFFETSFRELMMRDPEWVTTEGLTANFGTSNTGLTDLSDSYVRETQDLQNAILERLLTYDRSALSPEQQISYDVYAWYLDDLVRQQAFMYDDYPITHFVTGIQYQVIQLFTDIQPLTNKEDAEAYIERLRQVDAKFAGLVEGLELRKQSGVVLPRFLFGWVMGDIRGIANAPAERTPFYTAFEAKVQALDLSSQEEQALLQSAQQAIEESVIPAFASLTSELEALQKVAPTTIGASTLPDGEAYYAQMLRHFTTTDMTATEIHELGLRELARIQTDIRAAFEALGYDPDRSIADLYAQAESDGGTVTGKQISEQYEALIRTASGNLGAAFDLRPKAEVVVFAGDSGDFYVSAALDGSRPGAFYARIGGGATPLLGMPSVTYHETIPGHHLQIALAQESDLPLFRNIVTFLGYTEGWALYAEQLAYELGWYDGDTAGIDGRYGNLGRLRDQAFRAARLVVDTGIHTQGWGFDQAVQYMVENVGRDPQMLQFEVSRYITWPGQATAYMVGMLEIQELRQRAMDELGEQFDLKAFHRVVLQNGSMPLDILERVVDDYIGTELAR